MKAKPYKEVKDKLLSDPELKKEYDAMGEPRKQFNMRLPVSLIITLKHISIDQNISMADWIEEAIREKLEREKR